MKEKKGTCIKNEIIFLEGGTVQVNNKTERGPDHFPFLGVKNSGVDVQGIRYSIEAMTRVKATVINLNK